MATSSSRGRGSKKAFGRGGHPCGPNGNIDIIGAYDTGYVDRRRKSPGRSHPGNGPTPGPAYGHSIPAPYIGPHGPTPK